MHGGGVTIYVNNALSFKVLLCGPSDLELIVISLQTGRRGNTCLGVFYRPPSSPSSIFDTLSDSLFSIDHTYFSNFVLLGDFNVNIANPDHPLYNKIEELMDSFVLTQVVTSPTHISPNSEPSVIDLVFISNMHLFKVCNIIPQLANSDHFGLHVCIKHTSDTIPQSATTRRKIWRYKHADFNRANDLLMDIDLESIIDPCNIHLTWSNWRKVFLDIMDECIPTSTLPNRKNLPWLTKDIIQLMRKRNNLFKKAKDSNDPNDLQQFKAIRNKVVSKIRSSKQSFFSSLNPKCPKDFWKSIKAINPSSGVCTISSLFDSSTNTEAKDNSSKAELATKPHICQSL